MRYNEAKIIAERDLLSKVAELYGLQGYEFRSVESHVGGRNLVYTCEKEGERAKILRVSFLKDRSLQDYLGEVEYIRYLFEHGGSVADVVCSRQGNLVEEITYENRNLFVCLFEKAKGRQLAENYFRYREGAPIAEYWYNCGKVLGKLHQLSKGYTPDFFDKYTVEHIDKLVPNSLTLLKEKLKALLQTLEGLYRGHESFGMIHFDFNDWNYSIDFDTGQITVYDFDNSCYCWYMFDLAALWNQGVGWFCGEPDAAKRKKGMDDYFATVLAGYRSETELDDSMLAELPLFVQANQMEWALDVFEEAHRNGQEPELDEELSYLIKCLEEDIPYKGFFHEIYSCEAPFELESRVI